MGNPKVQWPGSVKPIEMTLRSGWVIASAPLVGAGGYLPDEIGLWKIEQVGEGSLLAVGSVHFIELAGRSARTATDDQRMYLLARETDVIGTAVQ